MNNNETIDNFLYDEENPYTQANDLWDGFFAQRDDEIDERPWVQADSLSHRNDLNRQVSDMIDRVLTSEDDNNLVRLYFGIGRRRHTMEELAILFGSELHVARMLSEAIEKLRYSDEVLDIYRYLHR